MVNDTATKSRKVTENQPLYIQNNLTNINDICSINSNKSKYISKHTYGAQLVFDSFIFFCTDFTFTILVFVYNYDEIKE